MKRKNNDVDNMAYKFTAYPTEEQRNLFARTVGCVRFVYNHILADKKSHYEATKENINLTPAQYKKEFEFLKEVDSLALANSQMALNKAFLSFYKGNTKFPKFKAKHRSRRAYTTNCVNRNIKLDENYLTLPKMGSIRIKRHRTLRANGTLKSVIFSQDSDGKYYVSILFEYRQRKIEKNSDLDKAVGLDMSMKELFVSSDGQIGDYPRYYRAMAQALNFGKSVCDNGWGIFRSQLVYKHAAVGKALVIIDKWFPSSKTCIECGYIHRSLTLSDRIYICPVCGNIIDRDYQAANNIKNEGLRILNEALLKDLEPQELAGIAC